MSRRIPKEIKEEIISRFQAGERVVVLAEQYAVSTKTIYASHTCLYEKLTIAHHAKWRMYSQQAVGKLLLTVGFVNHIRIVEGSNWMKRMAFTLLIVLLALVYVDPAAAHTGHECTHDGNSIEELQQCFTHALDNGHITNQGIARSLFAKLDAALAANDAGQTDTAANILTALVNQIEAQAGKHIAEPHATHMIEHTQRVIAALG